jgi:hypothetical protein
MNYANGCQGGFIESINDYFVDHGAMDLDCVVEEVVEGDARRHMELTADDADRECFLESSSTEDEKIICNRYSVTISPGQRTRTDRMFCECADGAKRGDGWSHIETHMESPGTKCMGEKLVDGQVTTTCKNWIVPNADGKRGHSRNVKVTRMAAGDPKGASYLFGEIEDAAGNINTDAQQMCRCPETDLVISPPGGFRFFEVGKGRSKSDTCARNAQGRTNPDALRQGCRAQRVFHSSTAVRGAASDRASSLPQSEEVMQYAILDGGPISAGFAAFSDFSKHDGSGVYRPSPVSRKTGGHAIMLFGWGTEADGTKFWWAKNSYGKHWPTQNANGIFKILRGEDKRQCGQVCMGLEEDGAAWVYVNPGQPPRPTILPRPLRSGREPALCSAVVTEPGTVPATQSCLRVYETRELLSSDGRIRAPRCEVENVCSKVAATYKIATTGSIATCGQWNPNEYRLSPGETRTHEGYTTCCIKVEKHDTNIPMREPGHCMVQQASRRQCVLENTCAYDVDLAPTPPGPGVAVYSVGAKGSGASAFPAELCQGAWSVKSKK